MSEMQYSEKTVNIGESIPTKVINQCDHPIEVGMGIVFGEDGRYVVNVSKNTIRVSKSDAHIEEDKDGDIH